MRKPHASIARSLKFTSAEWQGVLDAASAAHLDAVTCCQRMVLAAADMRRDRNVCLPQTTRESDLARALSFSARQWSVLVAAAYDALLKPRAYCKLMVLAAVGLGGVTDHLERAIAAGFSAGEASEWGCSVKRGCVPAALSPRGDSLMSVVAVVLAGHALYGDACNAIGQDIGDETQNRVQG